MTGALEGRRVLVVGASSGLGAAFARAASALGATVAVAARRKDRLDELAAEMGTGLAIEADATDPQSVKAMAATAAESLGAIDLMFYVAGYGVLQPLAETDPETWHDVFGVNVVGANLATAAVLPHLDDDGTVAFMSSRTVEDTNSIFATYSATKAALDQCIRIWRVEHPERRFVRVVMGNSAPTEFSDNMNADRFGEAVERWKNQAIGFDMMHADDVGRALAESFAVMLDHPEIHSSELKFDPR